MLAVYFVRLPATSKRLRYRNLLLLELEAQYANGFAINRYELTISEFSHNSILDFFRLELLFCNTKWVKIPNCYGTVILLN